MPDEPVNARERDEEPAGAIRPPEDGNDPQGAPQSRQGDADTFSRSYVDKLRKEAGDHRVRARELEDTVAKLRARLLEDTIRWRGQGKLADPGDLLLHADHESLLDDDGTPDVDAIDQALSTLAQAKPYLGDRRPRGDVDQGAREQPETVDLAGMLRARAG